MLDDVLWRVILLIGIILGTTLFFWFAGIDWRSRDEKATQQKIDVIADNADQNIKNGVYAEIEKVEEKDSWGNQLQLSYDQEGVGQRLLVRSAGKDGRFQTEDDLTASRWLLNASGIGQAASSYAGDVARESAKGAVDGIKESVKESFSERFGGLLSKPKLEGTEE